MSKFPTLFAKIDASIAYWQEQAIQYPHSEDHCEGHAKGLVRAKELIEEVFPEATAEVKSAREKTTGKRKRRRTTKEVARA